MPAPLPLWPLPLLAGLLPGVAGLAAWAIATQAGLVPACNVFLEGCISVSRAARHELPNHLFRALVLPAAVLQALTWLLAARWCAQLLGEDAMPARRRALALLGALAAVGLVAYGAFLGTEGAAYRWLRRYGTVAYFGCTCLSMLLTAGLLQEAARRGRLVLPAWLRAVAGTLGALLVGLGLASALAGLFVGGETRARVENVAEWWGSLIFVAAFLALAALWRRERVGLAVSGPG